jgi:hypothetical protein
MFGSRKLTEERTLLPPTRIVAKSATDYGVQRLRAAQVEALVSHDDIFPANPNDPQGWPKWRRVVTSHRGGFWVVYTEHESAT